MNYPLIPRDNGGAPLQDYPAAMLAKARYYEDNASASSVISVTHNTTAIEITAAGGAAIMRWVPTTDTTASVTATNFDHAIPADTMRRFAIPKETAGLGGQSVVGINRDAGLYQRVAYKSVGTASILTSEY